MREVPEKKKNLYNEETIECYFGQIEMSLKMDRYNLLVWSVQINYRSSSLSADISKLDQSITTLFYLISNDYF